MLIISGKQIIGRREKVDFPELDLSGIGAKVDTGANTSSIHCHDVQLVKRGGKKMVHFRLLDPSHPAYNHKEFTLPLAATRSIKSSFGDRETRHIIKTKIRLFNQDYDVELSLTDRSKMEYPVLLGRKLLKTNFIVDVDRVDISEKMRKRAEKEEQRKKKKATTKK